MRNPKSTKSATSAKTTMTTAPKMARVAKAKPAKTYKVKLAKDLKAELNPTCEHLRKLFAGVDQTDSIGRYEIGALVRDVKINAAYGKRGVRSLAADLQIDPTVLYAHAVVATVWTLPEFKKLASRLTAKKNALSFSNWIELAQVQDEYRDGLIKRALDEDLSVRAMKDAVAAISEKQPRLQVVSNMFVTTLGLAAQQSRWMKSFEAIRQMAFTPALADQLDAAIARNEEARTAWEENGKALATLRQQVAETLARQNVETFRTSEQANGQPEATL